MLFSTDIATIDCENIFPANKSILIEWLAQNFRYADIAIPKTYRVEGQYYLVERYLYKSGNAQVILRNLDTGEYAWYSGRQTEFEKGDMFVDFPKNRRFISVEKVFECIADIWCKFRGIPD